MITAKGTVVPVSWNVRDCMVVNVLNGGPHPDYIQSVGQLFVVVCYAVVEPAMECMQRIAQDSNPDQVDPFTFSYIGRQRL